MDDTPSINDLISKSLELPPIPSSMAPRIVSEPMQYSRNAVSSPSVNFSFPIFSLVFKKLPNLSIALSNRNNSPITAPVINAKIICKTWVVFKAIEIPRKRVNNPTTWKKILIKRLGSLLLRASPRALPATTVITFTIVPNMNS